MEIRLAEVPFDLHGAWQSLTTIAEHKGTGDPFPSALPDALGCDFDAVKRFVCKFRLGALKSVDMVMPGRNGRFYFVEFKDVQHNRISELRRKAFDSLVVFWLSVGKDLSMDEICANSEFILVKPDSDREKPPSEKFFEDDLRQDATSLSVPTGNGLEPLELQLQELQSSGLYDNTRVVFASDFHTFWNDEIEPSDETIFLSRLADHSSRISPKAEIQSDNGGTSSERRETLNEILSDSRTRHGLPPIDFCDDSIQAKRFLELVFPILQKREYKPEIERRHMTTQLFVADAIQPENNRLFLYLNWNEMASRPLASLVNRVFDGFFLWAWQMFSDRPLNDSLARFSMSAFYDGEPGPFEKDGKPPWVQQFLEDFLPWFSANRFDATGRPLSFGLACYRDHLHFYRELSTFPVARQ